MPIFDSSILERFSQLKSELAPLELGDKQEIIGAVLSEITRYLLDSDEVIPITETLLKTTLANYWTKYGIDEESEGTINDVVSQMYSGARKLVNPNAQA